MSVAQWPVALALLRSSLPHWLAMAACVLCVLLMAMAKALAIALMLMAAQLTEGDEHRQAHRAQGNSVYAVC